MVRLVETSRLQLGARREREAAVTREEWLGFFLADRSSHYLSEHAANRPVIRGEAILVLLKDNLRRSVPSRHDVTR